MSLNAAEIIFLATAKHIVNPRENLLEEGVDDLAQENKIPRDRWDLMEEGAEELLNFILDDQRKKPGSGMFYDITSLDCKSPGMQALEKRRLEFISSNKDLLEQLATEEDELLLQQTGEEEEEAEQKDPSPANEEDEEDGDWAIDAVNDILSFQKDNFTDTAYPEPTEKKYHFDEDGEDDPENEKTEEEQINDQIEMAKTIFKNMKSNMLEKEQDALIDAANELDEIAATEPLHLYYARANAHPSLANE